MRLLISTILFFFINNYTLAEENIRYYDIELVVFENLEESADNNEIWPSGKQLVVPDNATILGQKFKGELPPEYDSRHLFKLLSLDDYQLKEHSDMLKESENYRVLLHMGWRQPGLARDKAIPIHFTHVISENTEEPAPQEGTVPNSEPDVQSVPASSIRSLANLEGVINIVLSRYLHLDVEMLYKKEADDVSVDMYDTSFLEERSDREPIYYLKQNRRMRSKETHYIDHPKFSMLVRITPFKIEVPKITVPNG
ncbi:MAG: peptidoglycan binding protein CsiV [Gammaproteobacteria bacterium]|nr:peptidoglycan binding protein CsiV [Gammaproteobacteria bacterium]